MSEGIEGLRAEVRRLTRLVEAALDMKTDEERSGFVLSASEVDRRPDLLRKPKQVMGGKMLLDAVRGEIRRRDSEEKLIPAHFLEGPAWFMLLFLMTQKLAGRSVSITDAISAARSPQTTALRWVTVLVEAGWCVRDDDPTDKRRSFITLSDKAYEAIATAFEARRVNRWRMGLSP